MDSKLGAYNIHDVRCPQLPEKQLPTPMNAGRR
jgi:hypothetical protein